MTATPRGALADFLLARLVEERDAAADPHAADDARALIVTVRDLASQIRRRGPGWELQDETLVRLAADYESHPDFLDEWRQMSSDEEA